MAQQEALRQKASAKHHRSAPNTSLGTQIEITGTAQPTQKAYAFRGTTQKVGLLERIDRWCRSVPKWIEVALFMLGGVIGYQVALAYGAASEEAVGVGLLAGIGGALLIWMGMIVAKIIVILLGITLWAGVAWLIYWALLQLEILV